VSEAPAFTFVCQELGAATSWSELESRGTVRIALKSAGFDAKTVSADQMQAVLAKVMPAELRARGCADPERIVRDIELRLRSASLAPAADSPEDVFARLGR
jgi:hypothetical protein